MRRVLLKLSGEALAGAPAVGPGAAIDPDTVGRLAQEIAALVAAGTQLAIVLGGGNLVRGASFSGAGINRVTADQIGMLATVMNGLAVRDLLRHAGVAAQAFSALEVPGVVDGYDRGRALAALDQGVVAVFVAGTGNPLFTTDTAACLRGIEIGADAVLKATKVDGVYSADPVSDPDARRFEALSYEEVLRRNLGVMDLTAICLCRDHDMPLVVFDLGSPGALTRIINGDKVGTRIYAATSA